MVRKTLAILAVLAFAATSQAGVIISKTQAPTVGLNGYTTVTLTAATDDGSQIQGFDFASQAQYGFFGSMNQVNPFTLPTIFNDNNTVIPAAGADVSADSQFKFKSSDLTIPAGFAEESASKLRAVFAASAPWGTSVAFAQLAIPDAAAGTVNYVGQVQTVVGAAVTNVDVSGAVVTGGGIVPEPACFALLGLACFGYVGFRRR